MLCADAILNLHTSGAPSPPAAILTDMQQLTKGEGLLRRAVGLLEPAQGGTATGQGGAGRGEKHTVHSVKVAFRQY